MGDPQDFNTSVINDFRANEGKVGGPFEGAPMLLLHTTGAKSGAERVHPMMYLSHEGRFFVFASKAGADSNPDWYTNAVANPAVGVEIGSETFAATASSLVGAERDRIYGVQAGLFPNFAEYQAKTSRVIPVLELVRN
jgi:deazaflavin-dependent oxidoreductase (nitroreductase family)